MQLEKHRWSHHDGQIFLFEKYTQDSPNVDDFFKNLDEYFEKQKPEEYSCDTCRKVFSKLRHLEVHISHKHTGSIKPHQCKVCDKAYASIHNLMEHIKRGRCSERCALDTCGKSYSSKRPDDRAI